jgi:general secretion pathway protein H
VVVITLLALFSSLSLPLLLNRGESGERRTLRRLAGTVKQLYNEASLTRDEHLLTFDLDSNSISAYRLLTADGTVEPEAFGKEASLRPWRLLEVAVTGKGSFRHGQVSVRVLPLGWMEQTRVVLQNEAGEETFLDFSPLTGSTKIAHARQLP